MGDGVVQLLFIVAVIVASVFDAVGRNRKRREQQEREQEEVGDEGLWSEEDGEPVVFEGEPWEPSSSARTDDDGAVPSSRRSAADDMLPPDLWAILTGQAPPPGGPRTGAPQSEASRTEAPRTEAPRREATGTSEAQSQEVWGVRPIRVEALPAPTRRSARWMEGVSDADRARGAESTAAAGSAPRRPVVAALGELREPWDLLPDITAGEIGALPSVRSSRDPRGSPARGSSGVSGSSMGGVDLAGLRSLVGGSVPQLQTAVLLRELLGPPLGSQDLDQSPRDRG